MKFVLAFIILSTFSARAEVESSEECRVAVSYSSSASRDVGDIDVESAFEEALIDKSFFVVPFRSSPDLIVNVSYEERWTSGLFPNCMCNFGQTKKKNTSVTVTDKNGVSIYSYEKSSQLNRSSIGKIVKDLSGRLLRSRLACSFRRI